MVESIAPPASRNDPCPCGSGKRYKHCHGVASDSTTATATLQATSVAIVAQAPTKADLVSVMQNALAAHQAGRLEAAKALYAQALTIDPNLPDVIHMSGVIALTEGRADEALALIEHAMALGLDTRDIRYNLSLAKDALRCRQAVVTLDRLSKIERCNSDRFISPNNVQLLAYYLPQFHAIAENDAWWGKGFTEWTNVRRAKPNFEGHDQPRAPGELGYYNLLDSAVRAQQVALARAHGVTGFCYYHYWFRGKRLLESPLEQVLASGEPDFPFCVFWANENWTKRWDGGNNETLIAQHHDHDDDRAFIEHLLPYFNDRRYIRIDGRPLLMIYRFDLFPAPRQTIALWRDICKAHGLPPPFVIKADTRHSGPPQIYRANGSVEIPPHRLNLSSLKVAQMPRLSAQFSGHLVDYRRTAALLATNREPAHLHFRTVVPDWDNTARKQFDGSTFVNGGVEIYRAWLRETLLRAETMLPPGKRIVFVNAWNEWAEGAYLEPDEKNGRKMLEATLAARYIPAGLTRLLDATT